MQQKVFISSSSKDAKIAQSICMALETRGHRCWMSSRDVEPGENYQGAIVRAIRDAGVMVIVFSTHANNSEEIKKELALASQSRVMVIPVRAEDVLPSEDFTYELATRQWIDLFEDWERALDQLGHQIDHAIPRTDPPLEPRRPRAKNRTPLLLGVAAALAVVALGGFWLMRAPPPPLPREAIARPQPPASPVMDPARMEADLWDSVKESGDKAALNSYLAKFPNGLFAAAAKARLAALNVPAQAVPPAAKAVAVKPKAKTETRQAKTEAKIETKTEAAPAAPIPAVSAPNSFNPQVQQAVDMARAVEKQARAKASEARAAGADAQNGLTVVQYPGGDRYEGEVLDGRRSGLGVHVGGPSRVYRERVGQFSADQMSGYGVVYRNDGRIRLGHWKNAMLDGYAAVLDAQGHVAQQGLYVADVLQRAGN